jgi:hypothetical protein
VFESYSIKESECFSRIVPVFDDGCGCAGIEFVVGFQVERNVEIEIGVGDFFDFCAERQGLFGSVASLIKSLGRGFLRKLNFIEVLRRFDEFIKIVVNFDIFFDNV